MFVTLIDSYIRTKSFNTTISSSLSLGLAYLAAYLKERKVEVCVIDAVGEGIDNIKIYQKHYTHWGLEPADVVARIPAATDIIGISASHSCQHNAYLELLRMIKTGFPDTPVVFGGVHASAYYESLLEAGADYIILGEGEESFYELCLACKGKKEKLKNIDGIAYKENNKIKVNPKTKYIKDIDSLPFPAREMFPLENYFRTKLVHSPVNFHHTPIISSRGCPHRCAFCSVGAFWKGVWRGRSPKGVVDEIQYCYQHWNIREFYFMDDDLTADKERARQICNEIISRKLKIIWYASTGLRSENLDEEMLRLMKKSGCGLIALSPESGSLRVLTQLYGKKVDLNHIKNLVQFAHQIDLRTIVYFVIGCKGETLQDRQETTRYIIALTKLGMDEMGLFVFITHPKTAITNRVYNNKFNVARWEDMVQGTVPLSHVEYLQLKHYKVKLYFLYFIFQFLYHPAKIFRLLKNFILNRQQTKSDRALVMIIKIMLLNVCLKRLVRACLKPFRFLLEALEYSMGILLKIFLAFLRLLKNIKVTDKFVLKVHRYLIEFIYSIKLDREYYSKVHKKRLLKCKGVFPFDIAITTGMIIDYLCSNEQLFKNRAVLDMGAGTGAIGLELDSFSSLELADIDNIAIKNLYINTNDYSKNIRITQSDLFENIDRSFDTIIWNPPYFKPQTKKFIRSIHLKDEELTRFFSQSAERLNPKGRIIISYSSLANLDKLQDTADKTNFNYKIVKEKLLNLETLYVIELWKKEEDFI